MSKTIEQLLEEIKIDESLRNDLEEAIKKDKDAVISFMRDNGCDASIEEAKKVIKDFNEKAIQNGEIAPEQLEQVSGGSFFPSPGFFEKVCD